MRASVFLLALLSGCASYGLEAPIPVAADAVDPDAGYRTSVENFQLAPGGLFEAFVQVPDGVESFEIALIETEGVGSADLSVEQDGSLLCSVFGEPVENDACVIQTPAAGTLRVRVTSLEGLTGGHLSWNLNGVPHDEVVELNRQTVSGGNEQCVGIGVPDALGELNISMVGPGQQTVSATNEAEQYCSHSEEDQASCSLTFPVAGDTLVCGNAQDSGVLTTTWYPAESLVDTYLQEPANLPFTVTEGTDVIEVRAQDAIRVRLMFGQFEMCVGEEVCRVDNPAVGPWTAIVDGWDVPVRVGALGASVCEDDAFEPNDSADTAAPGTNWKPDLQLTPTSRQDFFYAAAEPGETLDITAFFSHEDGDLDLALETEFGEPLAHGSSITDNESVSYVNTSDEVQFYRVKAFLFGNAEACMPYSLEVNTSHIPLECSDPMTGNETQSEAVEAFEASAVTLTAEHPEDWYRFDIPAGERLTVNTWFDHRYGDVDLHLVDSEGTVLASSSSSSDNESVWWDNPGSESMEVFAQVLVFQPQDHQCPVYDLDFQFEPSTNEPPAQSTCPFEIEGNDTIDEAIDWQFQGDVGLSGDRPEDWYVVNVPPLQTLEIDATFSHEQGDIDIALFNENGDQLASSASTSDNENLVWENDNLIFHARLLVRVKFFQPNPGECTTYVLDMTETHTNP